MSSLIPFPEKIPVAWPWFEVLLIVTFLIHLILMNFILGGSLITLFDLFKGKSVVSSSKNIPVLIALTINFGVPPLLFVQVLYGHLFYSSSIIMAVPWILVIPILIIAYYGAYIFVYKKGKNNPLAKLALLLSTLLLLTIAFFYVNNLTLMLRPDRWQAYFDNPGGTNLNLTEPTLIPRYLHFVIASVAVAGLGIATFAFFNKKLEEKEKSDEMKKGLKIFSIATIVQIVIGFWFWFALPDNIMMMFMGKNILLTILLVLGILLAIPALIGGFKGNFKMAVFSIVPILLIMILIRDFVRGAYLSDVFKLSSLEVTHKYGSLVLFLVAFLAGIALLYYMITMLIKSHKTN